MYEEIVEGIKGKGFINELGIGITEISEGCCKGELPLDERLLNPYGTVHGGCIFALADTIGGCAALTHGEKVVTLDSTIHYLNPAMNTDKLIAMAREIKYGSKIAVYEVTITDAGEQIVATIMLTYCILRA